MTANRVETGTKEERMTIKSKRGGGVQRILQGLTRGGGGGQVNFIATLTKSSVPPFPPGDKN